MLNAVIQSLQAERLRLTQRAALLDDVAGASSAVSCPTVARRSCVKIFTSCRLVRALRERLRRRLSRFRAGVQLCALPTHLRLRCERWGEPRP